MMCSGGSLTATWGKREMPEEDQYVVAVVHGACGLAVHVNAVLLIHLQITEDNALLYLLP